MNILLIIALVFFFPLGGAQEVDANNCCGPAALACIVEHVNGSDFSSTVKRIEKELAPWDHLPEQIPCVGGATFPWGICHAAEKEGIKGRMLVGSCELSQGQQPFIAVIREEQGWHYVAVLEVQRNELVTNDGRQTIEDFLHKWRWSAYWRWQVEPLNKGSEVLGLR